MEIKTFVVGINIFCLHRDTRHPLVVEIETRFTYSTVYSYYGYR